MILNFVLADLHRTIGGDCVDRVAVGERKLEHIVSRVPPGRNISRHLANTEFFLGGGGGRTLFNNFIPSR